MFPYSRDKGGMRRTRRQRGVAAVEFALLAVLLVTIAFGATELGRAFYQYNTLVKSTRAAAREYTLAPPGMGNREEEAKCLAVYGKRPPCDEEDVPVVPGLAKDDVTLAPLNGEFTIPNLGTFTYSYGCATISGFQFVSLVEWVVPSIPFADISTCMRQLPA